MERPAANGNAVTPVVLGLLSLGPHTGYEIKQIVDRSTRYFWAASYGQIYPELRRLEAAGLITGEDAPTGGRRRRLYRLTGDGHQALTEWLIGHETTIELRDESLLRLFFADAVPNAIGLGLLEARQRGHEHYLEELRAVDARPGDDPPFVDLVLRWGIAFHEWGARWCEEERARLAAAGETAA